MGFLAAGVFAWTDWAVLLGYFALLALTGYVLSRRTQASTEDYFLGGRRMPTWAVALSVLATSLSAATFIGGPEQSFRGDLTYLSANLGGILAAIVVAVCFLPAFYRHRVTTVYQLLEHRFGRSSRLAAGWMFMVGRVFASGARLYIAALAGSLILFGDIEARHLNVAIAAFVLVGIFYTLVGGISSVIWSDVIQTFVFVGAACAGVGILLSKIPADTSQIVAALKAPGVDQPSKLTVIEAGLPHFDLSQAYTLVTAITGFTLFNLAAYGTDQDLAQRMLTCKTAARGSWSMISAILVGIPVTLLFMLVGLLLFIFYRRPDIMGAATPGYAIDDSREVFLTFIMKEMPAGMTGLMMAGLFAAALSSVNSALNAMASSFVVDFYRDVRSGRDEAHYVRVGRWAVCGWGVVLGLFAVVCVWWHRHSGTTLIDFALGVMTFAYAGLLAVFLAAMFTRRGSGKSAIAALVVGFVGVLVLQPNVMSAWWSGAPTVAFPWRMVIATAAAFGVCVAGGRSAGLPARR